MKNQFIEAGQIVGTHGIKGEMRVDPWMDSPEILKRFKNLYFDNGKKSVELLTSRVHKNILLITTKNVNSATEADLLRGKILYIDRDDVNLPKNLYFISDLIGLKVYDGNNDTYYGEITEVFKTGANNVYKIVKNDNEYLFPAVDEMIKSTDIDEGKIFVLPIDGIFDDSAEEYR